MCGTNEVTSTLFVLSSICPWLCSIVQLHGSSAELFKEDCSTRVFLRVFVKLPIELKLSEVAQSCPTLWDPMDYSLPGSSVHGILQARVLEWVAISFSRRSSRPRDWTQVSCIAGRCFTVWATREACWVSALLKKVFYWSVVALQCCVGFYYTAKWISYK